MSDVLAPAPAEVSVIQQANRTFRTRLKALQSQLKEIGKKEEDSAQIFHKTRVLTRKIQAATFAYRTLLPKKLRSKINRQTKEIRQKASEVRDIDVCLELTNPLISEGDATLAQAAVALKGILKERRELALNAFQDACFEAGQSEAWNKLRKKLDKELLSTKDERHFINAPEYGLFSIQSAWQEVIDAHDYFENGGETDEELHGLRKKVKRFRYTVELFPQSLDKAERKTILEACKKVQDALGAVTDILQLRTVTCHAEISLRKGTIELRQAFTHLHQWLDDQEFDLRDRFKQVWHQHFIPVARLTEPKTWPMPVQESFDIPHDQIN